MSITDDLASPEATPGAPQPDVAHTVAGFRLIRKLGSGARADVFLAKGDVVEPPESVAIKLFRSTTDAASIATEVNVLALLDSAHCVRLIDFATDPSGHSVLVLSRASRGSVARLLGFRREILAGEAVTILAPIAGAVDYLRSIGVAHSGISAASVHFGDRGEPVLLGFGHGRLLDSPTERTIGAAAADREQLAALTKFVLAYVANEPATVTPGEDVGSLVRWLDSQSRPLHSGFPHELQTRLFDLSVATAVSFEPEGAALPPALRRESAQVASRVVSTATDFRSPGVETPAAGWADVALGASPFAPIAALVSAALRTRLPTALRIVRRRFWIIAAAAVIAAGAAVVLLPRSNAGGVGADASRSASEEQRSGDPAQQPSESVVDPVDGLPPDPTVALPLLLAERARCFADMSALCLEAVDQMDSALGSEDSALITLPQRQEGEADGPVVVTGRATQGPFDLPGVVLVERLGDAAIVQFTTNGKPASALMIRTEAGWRLRELYGATS